MRKQVTFVEEIRKGDRLIKRGGSRVLATRSAESNNMYHHRYIDSEHVYKEQNTRVEMHRTAHFKVPDHQQVKTIHVPKSMMTAPFLQHPTLTTGQKRYLYSIANVYSTEHMRRLMKQHYLNVLHRCIKSGHSSLDGTKHTTGGPLLKDRLTFKMDNERDSGSRIKPYGQRKGTTVHSKVILPKITNSPSAE
ncbi:protein FAM216A [Salvelinus fontinalis]|uniref:protein FAM216A n=1 Tax=Salvelinus fontinalis TaxID=8038 RepID=UPI0024857125|nr:protein FAM216A [Salvelinus fontinalis]